MKLELYFIDTSFSDVRRAGWQAVSVSTSFLSLGLSEQSEQTKQWKRVFSVLEERVQSPERVELHVTGLRSTASSWAFLTVHTEKEPTLCLL